MENHRKMAIEIVISWDLMGDVMEYGWDVPSEVNQHNYGKWPEMVDFSIKMVIVHGYVYVIQYII